MTQVNDIPTNSYGILRQEKNTSAIDAAAEQIRNLGFAIVDSGYSASELSKISEEFEKTRASYLETYGELNLKNMNELHTIRALLTHGGEVFLRLALNSNLLLMINKLIPGKFILNQQNGVINPPQEMYNQGAWHRDLPYQHFISSQPLAINALFCIDDFTFDNGATFVLPASHKSESFPSSDYIKKHAIQIEAKAGSFIVLDCMLFHSGGFNKTVRERRAINHLYNPPFFKQQINIAMNMKHTNLSLEEKELLGFNYAEPDSLAQYFSVRESKK